MLRGVFWENENLKMCLKQSEGVGWGSRELEWGSRLAHAAISQWVHCMSRHISDFVVSKLYSIILVRKVIAKSDIQCFALLRP